MIKNIIKKYAYAVFILPRKFKLFLIKKRLGVCGKDVIIAFPCKMSRPKNVFMSDHTLIQPNVTFIMNEGKVYVGRWAVIASNSTIITDNHIPTVGINHRMLGRYHINDKVKDIRIGDDAWVGAGATLMSGASLGRGSIAATGCVVNKPVPPYAVVAGIPARIIASVFTKEQVIEHEKYLYPEEERMTINEIEELFETYFNGKRSIGIQGMSDYDFAQAERYAFMQYDVPRK